MKQERILSVLYLLSLVLLAGFALHGLNDNGSIAVTAPIEHPVIILDAGHGGTDGGASGPDGTCEDDLNLQIVKKLDCVLALMGENTLLTRTMDTDLSDPDARSISQKKVTDIRNRVKMINSVGNAVLISIHQNTYQESKYHGAQVFYGREAGSENLARAVQNSIAEHVDTSNLRQEKAISPDVYLMKHITVPGILVECGFLTNPQELQKLKSEDYQKQLAVVIGVTCVNQISNTAPEV
ncbi:MAG: N-acetylmuramoyl-L-alanine amidase [Oscillospiraceae bacterium]|nr:N-acetylmuramoyl-L-alanine amidase [Oscillospiraceae bacterium]